MGAEITKQLNKIEKKWVKNEKNKIWVKKVAKMRNSGKSDERWENVN